MGSPVLLLRLEGPLQSWGVRSRWDVRDTQPEPTKSGVIGLLGCALGYPTGDRRLADELDAGLRFGVRVEAPGRVLEDYQTVTDYLPTADGRYKHSGTAVASSLAKLRADPDARPATIISPRFYLEDAAFLVALEMTATAPENLLQRCADALQRPVWPLFLGRKACIPTRPIYEDLTPNYEGIEEALRRHAWSWLAGNKEVGRRLTERDPAGKGDVALPAFIDDPSGALTRQDVIQINALRQYGFRAVRQLGIHDGDNKPIKLSDVYTKEISDAR